MPQDRLCRARSDIHLDAALPTIVLGRRRGQLQAGRESSGHRLSCLGVGLRDSQGRTELDDHHALWARELDSTQSELQPFIVPDNAVHQVYKLSRNRTVRDINGRIPESRFELRTCQLTASSDHSLELRPAHPARDVQ